MTLRKLLAALLARGDASAEVGELIRQGEKLRASGEYERAQECYRRILVLQPLHAQARQELGNLLGLQGYALQERGEIDAAIENYQEALALLPDAAKLRNNLGSAYRATGRGAEAIDAFREAIDLDPQLAEGHHNLAVALHMGGAATEAEAHYRRAIALAPAFADAHLNLGFLLENAGDGAGAAACYAAAVEAQPDLAEAHVNLAMQLLLVGDFARGWEEYEWRLRRPDLAQRWPFRGRPHWDGAAAGGKTILLYAEQGFGDAIQFIRYAPLVAAGGARVEVVCQPKLARLFAGVDAISAVHLAGAAEPDFDLCCPLLSLPRLFGTVLDTIPAKPGYLHADADAVAHWRERFAAEEAALKVGLFWSTEAKSGFAPLKSLELASLAPLASVPGTVFYSLQRGAAAAQAAHAPPGMRLRDPTAELADFADDAALISSLDLVISIDTATAHLAGALGKPVWTLTHFPPEWRWLLGRDDSPWYPSMRLFRKQRHEDWDAVILRVAHALKERAALPPPRRGPARPV